MSNLYYIENRGCDDTTKGLAIIPDKFWDIFEATVENLNKNSSYGCMPRIAVYKIDETMIREAIEEDIDHEVMYLNGSKYVLNSPLLSNMRVI